MGNDNTQQALSFTANGVTFEKVHVEGGTCTMGATAEQGLLSRYVLMPACDHSAFGLRLVLPL